MGEDFGFHLTLFFGCLVGAITGYHDGGTILSVDGAFAGLVAGGLCGVILAELSDALWSASKVGAWLLAQASPLITLGALIALARQYWI